jgi:hypothetical protein
MKLDRLIRTATALSVLLVLAVPGAAHAAMIANGGFEAGDSSGWTIFNQDGGFGDWFVYGGTSSPINGFPIAAPPEGTFAAVTDQQGPGSHALYQDVALEPGFAHVLSFYVYYVNRAGAFATPPSLDYNVFPNQQYRVDVLRPTAPVTSVAPGDVLAPVFRTDVGEPLTLAPTRVTFDLSPFAGTTVRIRFAEVDNLLFFNASVDGVAVRSTRLLPTTKEQCKNGGWRNFGSTFKNQGDCVSFVATGGKNPPAGSRPQPPLTAQPAGAGITSSRLARPVRAYPRR